MVFQITPMTEADREPVLAMMRVFYASPAVLSNGSEAIFKADIDACLSSNPYLEGYVLLDGDAVIGYAMTAKSFSTEFGKQCIWIEDLYVTEDYRGQGIGTAFLQEMIRRYPNAVLRLEVEEENRQAVAAYQKNGFEVLPYMQMKRE